MFGNKEIINKLNKIVTSTALHTQAMDYVKKDIREHKENDTTWKKEITKKVGVCAEASNVKKHGEDIIKIDKKVLAINVKLLIYIGITMLILSGIVGSFFWIMRSALGG